MTTESAAGGAPECGRSCGYPGLPDVRRARGYRLYCDDGRRYLDCYLADGGAVLGHSPEGLGKDIKAEIDRGLYAAVPSRHSRRLIAALKGLFPTRTFYAYSSRSQAIAALAASAGVAVTDIVLADPALQLTGRRAPGSVVHGRLWRPYLPAAVESSFFDSAPIIPVLPGGHAASAVVVGFATAAGAGRPVADVAGPIRPLDLAILTRGALLAARYRHAPPKPPANEMPLWRLPPEDTRRLEALFSSSGPYLTPRCGKGEYGFVFDTFLSQGFYLAPSRPGPSLLPAHCSRGEFAAFLRVTDSVVEALR